MLYTRDPMDVVRAELMLRVALFAALAIVAFGDHRSQHVATTETPPSEWWLDHAIAIYNYTTSSKDYTGASRMCETETSFIVQFHGGQSIVLSVVVS